LVAQLGFRAGEIPHADDEIGLLRIIFFAALLSIACAILLQLKLLAAVEPELDPQLLTLGRATRAMHGFGRDERRQVR